MAADCTSRVGWACAPSESEAPTACSIAARRAAASIGCPRSRAGSSSRAAWKRAVARTGASGTEVRDAARAAAAAEVVVMMGASGERNGPSRGPLSRSRPAHLVRPFPRTLKGGVTNPGRFRSELAATSTSYGKSCQGAFGHELFRPLADAGDSTEKSAMSAKYDIIGRNYAE